MNTTNIELDSIIESFNMDIFIIEHNNFINIINKRINGEILNESIIQEGVKERITLIITKAREALVKLKQKIKEALEKIKEKVVSSIAKSISKKLVNSYIDKLKNVPDDFEFEDIFDINLMGKQKQNIEEIKSKLKAANNKLELMRPVNKPAYLKRNEEILEEVEKIIEVLPKGKYETEKSDKSDKNNFNNLKKSDIIQYVSKSGELSLYFADQCLNNVKIFDQLKKADKYLGSVGKSFVFVSGKEEIDLADDVDDINQLNRIDITQISKFVTRYINVYEDLIKANINLFRYVTDCLTIAADSSARIKLDIDRFNGGETN